MDLKTARRLLANQSKEALLRIIISLSGFSEEAEEWLLVDHRESEQRSGRQRTEIIRNALGFEEWE